MTYSPIIPQPGDYLSQSQSDILANFSQANVLFGVDHTAFNVALNPGFHKKITLPVGAAPGSAATQAVIYSKTVAAVSQLFLQRDGVAAEVQLTGPDPVLALRGQTFLPGGVIIKWGRDDVVSALGGTAIAFLPGLPNFPANCWVVFLTGYEATARYASVVGAPGLAGFTARASADTKVQWLAIGN